MTFSDFFGSFRFIMLHEVSIIFFHFTANAAKLDKVKLQLLSYSYMSVKVTCNDQGIFFLVLSDLSSIE